MLAKNYNVMSAKLITRFCAEDLTAERDFDLKSAGAWPPRERRPVNIAKTGGVQKGLVLLPFRHQGCDS